MSNTQLNINKLSNNADYYGDNRSSYSHKSEFLKPKNISESLSKFLGLEKGTQITRTEATREINKYIRINNLQDPNDRKKIIPDVKLSSLLNLSSSEELTYFNIQSKIKPHFDNINNSINSNLKKVKEIDINKSEAIELIINDSDSDDENSFDSSIAPEPPIVPIDNINLCFVGGVSTGKSTILNAIFCEELTQCKIKRTTMVPTIYVENENNAPNITAPDIIFTTISDKNKEIISKTETGKKLDKNEYKELAFNVGKLDINILNGSYVNVYDIPGLNDARTKDVYYSYLNENFKKFNLVVLLVDIHSGLNTSDEIDIVNFITTQTKYELDVNKKQIYTLVVVNKADDMQLNDEGEENTLKLTGELSEMFEQVENTIMCEFKRHDILKHLIGIIPLCAIDSYLYRMVKKHGKKFKLSPEQILKIGINENGKKFSTLKPATQEKKVYEILTDQNFIDTMIKLSGFSKLESILHKFLNENNTGKQIRIDNLLFEMTKYQNICDIVLQHKKNIVEIKNHVKKYNRIFESIRKIDYDIYCAQIGPFITNFNSALKELIANVKSDKKYELIEYYDDINKEIFQQYFSEFISEQYPDYIKDHVINMINDDFDNKQIMLKSLIVNFNILKKINMFTPTAISIILNKIIANRCKSKTLIIDDYVELNKLITLLKDCDALEINISKFMRFVMINSYTNCDGIYCDLYKTQMLFKKYGEIPMYSYITNLITSLISKVGYDYDFQLYVDGLSSNDFISAEYMFEMYYIQYEQKNNPQNFVL